MRAARRTYLVPVDSVDFIRASGNYVTLATGDREHLLRATLSEVEAHLDPARFCRVHRSTIVNLDRVVEFRHLGSGDLDVVLRDGRRLRMSRRYKDRLPDLLL